MDLREIKLVTHPGHFLLLVTPHGVYQHTVMEDDTISVSRGDDQHVLRLSRLSDLFAAIEEFYVDGDDDGLDEFRDRPHLA